MKESRKEEGIIISRDIAKAFVHHANHMDIDYIPEDIRRIRFKTKYGTDQSIEETFLLLRKRVQHLADYFNDIFYPENHNLKS